MALAAYTILFSEIPAWLKSVLNGIQFVLGDLPADTRRTR